MTINKVGQSPFYTEGEQAAIAGRPAPALRPPRPFFLASSAFIFDMLRMFLQSYNLCLKNVYVYQKKKTMDYIQSLREDSEEGMGP